MNFNVKSHVTEIQNNRVGHKMAVLQKNKQKESTETQRNRLSTLKFYRRFKIIVLYKFRNVQTYFPERMTDRNFLMSTLSSLIVKST